MLDVSIDCLLILWRLALEISFIYCLANNLFYLLLNELPPFHSTIVVPLSWFHFRGWTYLGRDFKKTGSNSAKIGLIRLIYIFKVLMPAIIKVLNDIINVLNAIIISTCWNAIMTQAYIVLLVVCSSHRSFIVTEPSWSCDGCEKENPPFGAYSFTTTSTRLIST